MYVYKAYVDRVVDGDTIHARVDLGCDVRIDLTLRLAYINAPERGTEEGTAATTFLKELIEHEHVVLHTLKDKREKYGRYLAQIYLGSPDAEGVDVNKALVDEGHAVPYSTR